MSTPPLSGDPGALLAALFDFQAAPGRFAIALNEPRILFNEAHAVLTLAAGRVASTGRTTGAENHRAQQSARFFVRHVLLRPGTSHYALLGLPADATQATVREHYRLLIRLTHPDFTPSKDPWPDDAAARVNLAYDVLSNPGKRSDYDQLLKAPVQAGPAPVASVTPPLRAKASAWPAGKKHPKRNLYIFSGLTAFSAIGMLGLFMASTPPEDRSLRVARDRATPAGPDQARPRDKDAIAVALATPAEPEPSTPTPEPLGSLATVRPAPSVTQPLPTVAPTRTSAREARSNPALPPSRTLATEEPEPAQLRLSLSTALASTSAPMAPALDTKAPAVSTLSHGSLPAALVTAPAPSVPALPARPLDMRHVQPLLAELVEALQSGNGLHVQQWTERASAQRGSGGEFAEAYRRAIAGARVTGLGRVNFAPRAKAGPHQIDGTVQLNLLNADQQTSVKTFRLRAYFVEQPEGPKLYRLEAE